MFHLKVGIMAKFYKVVTNSLESAWIGSKSNRSTCMNFVVKYVVGQFVRPKTGQLMVFSSLEDAESWRNSIYLCDRHTHKIYECEIKNIVPEHKAFFVRSIPMYIQRKLTEYMKLRSKHKSTKTIERDACTIPTGTVFCRQVKLTNLVS